MDEGAGGDPPSNRGSGSARPLLIASSSHLRSPLVRSPLSRSPQARVGRTVLGTGKKGAATHPATARVAEARPAATRAADVGAATTGAGQGVAGQVEEGAGQGVNGGGRGHLRARTVLPSLPSRTTYKGWDDTEVGDDSEDVEDSENEEEVHEDLPRYEQNQAPYVEYDHDDPLMEVGSTYPSMKVFRLAMSQHAIKHEFEYNIAKSGPKRFRAYCSRKVFDNCPWWIYATTTEDGCTVKENRCNRFTKPVGPVLVSMSDEEWERSVKARHDDGQGTQFDTVYQRRKQTEDESSDDDDTKDETYVPPSGAPRAAPRTAAGSSGIAAASSSEGSEEEEEQEVFDVDGIIPPVYRVTRRTVDYDKEHLPLRIKNDLRSAAVDNNAAAPTHSASTSAAPRGSGQQRDKPPSPIKRLFAEQSPEIESFEARMSRYEQENPYSSWFGDTYISGAVFGPGGAGTSQVPPFNPPPPPPNNDEDDEEDDKEE
ncbi:hypothetical protein PR202_ga04707 [Eleusine coracana subsp. coracana]|uniref:Transposase MuDR plant domain-containing protein n=1 Tax=Eleusine coracana subsp. coracana TaxID=191504 RepID=A0AAV5BSG6_ELECO|nr:hypothetical protein PR202_ga04707 [Eleusine coracana subsp. coracana]